jgi:hypothetical protein
VLAAAKVEAATASGNKKALKEATKALTAAAAFKTPTCELCTQGRGAMKPLVAAFGRGGPGRWAHILCKFADLQSYFSRLHAQWLVLQVVSKQ